MAKKLLTKVAKGVAFGDVSNIAIRNILTEISKELYGGITETQMEETMDYFDWKCPYTGKDMREAREKGLAVTDHIYPQNREYCGLNVQGNLVLVDKDANNEKGKKSVDDFFNNANSKVLANVDKKTRDERLKKIKEFQAKCGYDPLFIKKRIAPLLDARYKDLQGKQKHCIDEAIKAIGLPRISRKSTKKSKTTTSTSASLPRIEFYIAGTEVSAEAFKEELLKTKKATLVLTFNSGVEQTSSWDANSITATSNLRANIQSRPFWREKATTGLSNVKVMI